MRAFSCLLAFLFAGTSAAQFVYVANSGSDNVSAYAINPATGGLAPVLGSPFATGQRPMSVATDPQGRFLYVANAFSGSVSGFRINADTGGLVEMPGSPYAAGNTPWAVTVDRQGKFVFVANADSNNVSAFTVDANSGALTPVAGSPFAAGPWPRSLAVHPNNNYLYVINFFSGTISEYGINAVTGALTQLPGSPFFGDPFATEPSGAAFDPSGRYLYTSNFHSSNLSGYLVNVTTGALSVMPGSPFPDGAPPFKYEPAAISVDPLGRFAYVAQTNGVAGYTLNAATGVLTPGGLPAFGIGPQYAVAVDPTGRFAYVAGSGVTAFSVNPVTGALTAVAGPPLSTGTDPRGIAIASPAAGPCATFGGDTDGDGLCDTWERFGLTVNVSGSPVLLDLPAMGADPLHKDVFVEADFMVLPPAGTTPGHSHEPRAEALALIVQSFANAPVPNPDGTTGIALHVDCGPSCIMNPRTGATWGPLARGEAIAHQDALGTLFFGFYDWSALDAIKAVHLRAERRPVFHYCVFAHSLGGMSQNVIGVSRGAPGSDFILTLAGFESDSGAMLRQAGVFMHELGHNLGLDEGGGDGMQYKPNHLSVMNYSLSETGVDGRGWMDYSRFRLPTLDENNLTEPFGLGLRPELAAYRTVYTCGDSGTTTRVKSVFGPTGPIDWNCNSTATDVNLQSDVNFTFGREVLSGFNDWPNLIYQGGSIGQPALAFRLPSRTPMTERLTPEADARIPKPVKVTVSSPGLHKRPAGTALDLTFTVKNAGLQPDSYALTARSSVPWANLGSVPGSISLPPGASRQIPLRVTIPAAAGGTAGRFSIEAASGEAPAIRDIGAAEVTALTCGAPTIAAATPRPGTLWPPNGKMTPVTLTVATAVGCGGVLCKITGVTSNEPLSSGGDWAITGNLTLNLRAERLGSGTGRVYTITVQCTDLYGQTSTKTTTVSVPHDQGK